MNHKTWKHAFGVPDYLGKNIGYTVKGGGVWKSL